MSLFHFALIVVIFLNVLASLSEAMQGRGELGALHLTVALFAWAYWMRDQRR